MDLKSLLAAYALTSLAHPYGHVAEGNKNDIPVKIDFKNFAEDWDEKAKGRKEQTDVNGGGFALQDILTRSGDKETARNLALANAIYKSLYLAGSYNLVGPPAEGDVKRMKNASGNKKVGLLLAASILSDLDRVRNPDRTWDVSFTTLDRGAPGLLYTKRF